VSGNIGRCEIFYFLKRTEFLRALQEFVEISAI